MRWRRGRHRGTGRPAGEQPEHPPAQSGPARATWLTGRAGQGDRLVVRLRSCTGAASGEDICSIEAVATAGGASVVVADLTGLSSWDTAGLKCLLGVHRDLAARDVSLRLVVWSQDIYQALQALAEGTVLPVYANVDSALR